MRFLLFLILMSVPARGVNGPTEELAQASRVGDLRTAEALLSSGVNPNLPDKYGKTPLYYAASFNEAKTVALLLTYHADPNARAARRETEFPATPLQYAAELGNLHIASELMAAGARVDTVGNGGRTALHFAVLGRHLDLIQFLIEKGADLNARDREGTSPLDDAVWRGSLDAAAILLAHGARLNEAEVKTGATPINEAAYLGRTELVKYLLQFNPDLAIADNRGYTPLENAVRKGKEEAALLLLAAEAKEQKSPHAFEGVLEPVIRNDESLVLEELLRRGVSVHGVLPSGSTLLDTAASNGAAKIVPVLLRNSADPNVAGRNGATPLEDASLKGYEAIAAMLLDHGAQVNRLNSASGTTALYAAASFGKSNVVKLLLNRGANPNLCGKSRTTPYQAALANGYPEVAKDIQMHGGKSSCER